MAERSFPRRVFGRLGRGIDVLRTWLGRLFFIIVLVVIAGVLFGAPGPVQVPDTGALVLSPAGTIVEERDQPAFGAAFLGDPSVASTPLPDLLDAIDTAASDDRITSLVLHLDDLFVINPAQIEALQEALQRFRDSGKSIYAYGESFSQGQYALASQADRITMNPLGSVLLPGYGGNRLFFAGLLDRLRVNVHVFRTGEAKAAAEPWTRMDLSDAAREDSQQLVDALWERYAESVAGGRDLEPGIVLDYANNLPALASSHQGDLARAALAQGIVDELGTLEEFRQRMASRVGPQNGTFRQIDYRDYLSVTRSPVPEPGPKVAVLVAEGTIVSGPQAPGVISDEDMVQRIRQARSDDEIRALVLRVQSPGGGMLASEAIRSELSRFQAEGKPLVVSMGGTAASGGYWISSHADEIWATPSTITGSIGVISMIPTFEDSLSEAGIGVDGVGTTPLTLGADPLGGLSESMQELLQQNIGNAHERFVTLVSEGRGLDRDMVAELATGEVFTGEEARELELVDRLGHLKDAVESAAARAGLGQWQAVTLQRPRSAFEQFLQQMLEAGGSSPALQSLVRQLPGPLALLPHEVTDGLRPWLAALERDIRPGTPRNWVLCETCVGLRLSGDY